MWPGQFEKEKENHDKHLGAIAELKNFLARRSQDESILDIDQFSNRNVSLIFNHILKKCKEARNQRVHTENPALKKQIKAKTEETDGKQDEGKRKCSIF
jgi:hypothetical protein